MAESVTKSVAKQRAFKERRRAAGLCLSCGRPRPAEKVYCEACLAKRRKVSAERVAAGLCYCGRPAVAGMRRCPSCAQSVRDAHKKIRARRLAEGRCTYCDAPSVGQSLCEKCRERVASRDAQRVESGTCRCGRGPIVEGKRRCQICADSILNRIRRERAALIAAYGGRCVCCGEDDPNVLEIDHVLNDGAEHRKKPALRGPIYRWARANGFPPTLQILCADCHTAKTRTGDCSYRKALIRDRAHAATLVSPSIRRTTEIGH